MSERLEACEIPGRGYCLFLPPADERDVFHQHVAYNGNWDHVQDSILQLTDPGDTVLDLGSNIGTVTIPVARAGRHVIAYELLPLNARSLALSAEANGLSEFVTVRNGAVWDEPGEAFIGGHSAWGQVVTSGQAIDRIVIDQDVNDATSVNAIKIDVEGCELRALRGMRRLLTAQHPAVIFEGNTLTLSGQQTSVFEVVSFLEGLGYRVFRFGPHHVLTPWRADVQPSILVDYLATTLSDVQLSAKTGRAIRPLTNEEYAQTLAEAVKHGDVHLSYVAAIADFLPHQIRTHPICSGIIASAIKDLAASPHTARCRAGYGAPGPHIFMSASRQSPSSRLRGLWDRYGAWICRKAA
jgi:FkbM family methyltransferase